MILSTFPFSTTLRRRAQLPLALVGLVLAAGAVANPGDPDPGFGGDGIVYVDSGSSNDVFHAVHPAGDGAAYAAGALSMEVDNSADFSVVRLLRNGNPDPAFGTGGIAWIDTTGDADVAHDIALQADGKLLLAGSLENGAYSDFGLVRLLESGQPDTGFGEDAGNGQRRGYVRLNIGPTTSINDAATSLAVQSSGRIVVAGRGYAEDGSFTYARYALARFLADGSLDTSEPLDDVAFLYYARTLPLEVGETYTINRYFREDGNPVVLRVLRKETIRMPAGTFNTIVVQPIIQTDGLFGEGGEAEVYFTDDARRPVRLRGPFVQDQAGRGEAHDREGEVEGDGVGGGGAGEQGGGAHGAGAQDQGGRA